MLLWCWCFWEGTAFCFAWLVEKLFIPSLVAGLVYFLGIRQLKTKRTVDFAEKQLTEFYGPMVAARAEIEGFTRFDRILRTAAGHADSLHQERYRGHGITTEYLTEIDAYTKELERFYDGLNDRFRTTGIDALIRMKDLFARKIVFADPDTQPWFEYFHELFRVSNCKILLTELRGTPYCNDVVARRRQATNRSLGKATRAALSASAPRASAA